MDYSYRAFGLGIASAVALPELMASDGTVDVEIRRGNVLPRGSLAPADNGEAKTAPNEWRLTYDDVGVLTVRDGRQIEIQSLPGIPARRLRLVVLGPGMAAVLHQRGFLLLHASVVEIAGRAAAFLGTSGAGKSTLAAALRARGHRLMADDVAAVRIGSDGPTVYAGFPQLKLWPDAATALGAERSLPRVEPGVEKRAQRIRSGFAEQTALPLHRVFLLAEGPAIAIERLHPHAGLLTLAAHSYGVQRLDVASGARHLYERSEIVRWLGVHRLTRPRDFGVLSVVVERIERELACDA